MQVSYEWLNEFVDLKGIEPEDIAHRLTMSGLEVEEIEIKKPKFTHIITARILNIKNHPNADKLHLVEVDTGNIKKTVVCGAQNIETGQVIPYASVGSKVFSRKTGELFELTPAEIRGVKSDGMLCSCDELGLDDTQEEDGILILSRLHDNIELGMPLEKLLGLSEEIIFHLAPTANRGDEMSVLGVAKELSAIYNLPLHFSPLECNIEFKKDDFKVEIKDSDTCKYYSIGVIKNIKIQPSPDFIQRRITACGMRAINNIVDITNYVLLELGTPLHAFDYDKLENYLCVRYAKDGETITTIDNIERKLTNQSVLIATKKEGVCLAGVFGANNSEIDDNTKSIALEAAFFTPNTNRKSARSVGYRSEASARFERGIDIELVKPALLRAIDLIVRFGGGEIEQIAETGSNSAPNIEITLRNSEIKRIMGIEIEQEKCIEILQNLGFEILGKNELAIKVKVPSSRTGDVTRTIDLIEEITRVYGYDKIGPNIPNIEQGANVSFENRAARKISEIMAGYGFDEIVTSSLTGKNLYKNYLMELDDKTCVRVLNPQSEEHTTLRQNLAANMLNVVKYNFDQGQKNFWLWEIGKTYFIENHANAENSGVLEERHLSACIFGSVNNEIWNKKISNDFYTIKGILEAIFDEFNLSNRIVFNEITKQDGLEFLHPAQSAKVQLLGKDLVKIGYVGKVHPTLIDKMKLNQDLFIFEINLEEVLKAVNLHTAKYKKLPQFGYAQRDIAFAVNKERSWDEVEKIIKKSADKNIYKGVQVFDIYEGENIEQGKKSMAVRVTLQDENATLKDEIIEGEINRIKKALQNSIKEIILR